MDLRGAERGDEPASLRDTARGKPSGERGGATWAALSGGGDHGAVHVVCSAERSGWQPAHGSASRATAAVSAAVAGAGGDRVRVLGRRWAGRVRQAAAGWAATPLRRGDYAGVLPGHVSLGSNEVVLVGLGGALRRASRAGRAVPASGALRGAGGVAGAADTAGETGRRGAGAHRAARMDAGAGCAAGRGGGAAGHLCAGEPGYDVPVAVLPACGDGSAAAAGVPAGARYSLCLGESLGGQYRDI